MKKIIENKKWLIILIVIIVVLISLAVFFFIDKQEVKKDNSVNNETVLEDNKESKEDVYLVMSINPKIMLKINGNTIIEIHQLNEDADIFIPEELINLGLEDGITKIINIARENEFIKEDTIIEVSTFTQVDIDDEGNETVIELSNIVRTKIIEDGINVKPINMSNEEIQNIFDIVQNIPATNNEENDNNENDDNENTSDNTSNNTGNTNDSTNGTEDNNNEENEKPVVKQKLDINKVINNGSFITENFNVDVSKDVPTGYSSHEAYWQEMINKFNAGTFDDHINSEDCKDFDVTDCQSRKNDQINYYTLSVLNQQKNLYDGNYHKKTIISFRIGDDYYGGTGIMSSNRTNVPLYCPSYISIHGACGVDGPSAVEYTLTSDFDYYYLTFNSYNKTTGEYNVPTKCTAKSDMIFTCDNFYYIDEKTGQKINVFYP